MIQQKQGSPHDCTDNTTSATRHHKGAKPAQGLRKILAILMLMTISISTWAQTNANYVPFEFYTSINQITGNFAIVNAAEGKALYGPDAQNIGYADYATAFANNRAVTQYALENAGNGNYRLRCVTPAGGNYGLWGNNICYLNAQPNVGGLIFNLGLNNRNGQDMENGALWKLNYVAGQGWTIRNVANNGYAAPNNTTQNQAYYWQLCSLHETTQSTLSGYTFISNETNGYFLNSSAQASQTFAENTCVWTAGATMGGTSTTLRIGTTYLRGRNNNNANTARTGSNTDWYTTIWRSVNNYLVHYSSDNRYVYRNNNNVPAWNNNANRPNAAFGVYPTCTKTNGFFIVDNITGVSDEISAEGTYNLQSTAYFCPTYYTFTGGPDTRYYAAGYTTGAVTTAISAKTSNFTSDTWTLSRSLPGVSINNNGQLVITSLPGGQNDITITHTVTENGQTLSKTKTVRLIGRYETTLTFANVAPTVSADGWNVVLPSVTLKSGETTLTGRTITYSGTNCTVNSNGEVNNINGTATITASFAGDVTYAPSSTTYTITATDHQALNETIIGDIAITPATATLNLGGTQNYSVPASVTAQTRTCEQYTEYSFPVGTAYRYAGSSWKYTLSAPTITENPNATVSLTQVVWSFSGGAGSYYTPSTYSSTTTNVVTLTRTGQGLTDDQEYTITATATYGSVNREATAKVVIPAPIVDLSGITANPASYTIAVGGSADITCDYATTIVGRPYVSLTYSEYNTNLISVDANGRITGLAEGTTTVTIQSKKQGGTNGPRTTVSVTVSNGSGTQADPYRIANVEGLQRMNTNKSAYFIVTADFDASSFNTAITDFAGTLDGGFYTISGLKRSLFATINGGSVKNVILDNISVTAGKADGNIGAIAGEATNQAKIYNCGVLSSNGTSSVTGTVSGKSIGGLVGNANGGARIINCYSYANVSATSNAGGIVGYVANAAQRNSVSATNGTMVMNCMFYGNITSGTAKAPIYGGGKISNTGDNGLNNFNYYRYESPYSLEEEITTYNCALAAEERYLTRFEFYRNLLNSNRELAAWYVTGNVNNAYDKMAKWVLDKSIAPYPILKPQGTYPSIINFDAANAPTTTERNKGGKLGTLSVTISQGTSAPTGANITKSSLTLNITDKDEENFNYNYYKVQLPYYNEVGTGNYTNNKVVTGWEITVSGGTNAFGTADYDAPNYNFADRNSTGKDNYATSGRIFAQGGYFNVPEGVASISIKPHWADCVYLSDPNYDVVYSTAYAATNVTTMGGRYTNGNNYTINGSSQKVYTTVANAVAALQTKTSVYDAAIVLVGNVHDYRGGSNAQNSNLNSTTKSFTVMSADLNFDNEPDYSYIYQHTDRQYCAPIRFDFLNWPGIGMAQKVDGTTRMPNQGIFFPRGWFEITNTCIVRFTEFEYDQSIPNNVKSTAPLILMGGIYEQFTSTQNGNPTHTTYIHLGDNAWFKEFDNGTHSDGNNGTPHRPISVTGGEYEKFYLSGTFKPGAAVVSDNAECYINGGKFGELAGAGQEQIDGNVTWLIDHADIHEFYGGGINAAKPITGNIKVTIDNSYVDQYCGGPKFGNMSANKTVETSATGSTFGKYFGAGYGGTSYNRVITRNSYTEQNYAWDTWANDYGRTYNGTNGGISTNYEYEYFAWAGGGSNANVGRFYVNYASFSLAQTNNVSSTLNNCVVLQDYFGGGSLGKVNGNTASVLNDCTIYGSAFGGGYSATIPSLEVMNKAGFRSNPSYNGNVGVYNKAVYPATVTYTWSSKGTNNSPFVSDGDGNWLHTGEDLTTLGTVTGETSITINGGEVHHHVFGGGFGSKVISNTNVMVKGPAFIHENVYGGGNAAEVGGDTRVVIGE